MLSLNSLPPSLEHVVLSLGLPSAIFRISLLHEMMFVILFSTDIRTFVRQLILYVTNKFLAMQVETRNTIATKGDVYFVTRAK